MEGLSGEEAKEKEKELMKCNSSEDNGLYGVLDGIGWKDHIGFQFIIGSTLELKRAGRGRTF